MRKRIEDTRLLSVGAAKAYKLVDHSELRGVAPPEMLVEDLLPAGFVCALTSFPGVGKTWLACEIARAVCTGGEVMDQFGVVGGRQPVVFVGSDSSMADYGRQWRRITQRQHDAWIDSCDPELPREANPPNPFALIRFLIQSTFMLDNPDEVRRLIVTLRETSPEHDAEGQPMGRGLVVLDTLSRLTNVNQNDNTEMERVMAHARTVAEVTGATILLLHHNSKPTEFNDGGDFRGASSGIGALDSWVNLSAHKQSKEIIRAEFKKFRGITPESFEYKQLVKDPDTAKLTYLGVSGGFFGNNEITDAMLKEMAEWKTLAAVEEAMWPAHSDQFTDRTKFKKAIQNRLRDVFPRFVDRRGTKRTYEYKVKDSCPSTSPTSQDSSAQGAIPTT